MATPTTAPGSQVPSSAASVRSLVKTPEDLTQLVCQLNRIIQAPSRPWPPPSPTSVELQQRNNPVLQTQRNLPISPAVTYHTILGTGYFDPELNLRNQRRLRLYHKRLQPRRGQRNLGQSHSPHHLPEPRSHRRDRPHPEPPRSPDPHHPASRALRNSIPTPP